MTAELEKLRKDRDFLLAQAKEQFFVPTRDRLELQHIEERIAKLEALEQEQQTDV